MEVKESQDLPITEIKVAELCEYEEDVHFGQGCQCWKHVVCSHLPAFQRDQTRPVPHYKRRRLALRAIFLAALICPTAIKLKRQGWQDCWCCCLFSFPRGDQTLPSAHPGREKHSVILNAQAG